jgi:hypothetical protein
VRGCGASAWGRSVAVRRAQKRSPLSTIGNLSPLTLAENQASLTRIAGRTSRGEMIRSVRHCSFIVTGLSPARPFRHGAQLSRITGCLGLLERQRVRLNEGHPCGYYNAF